MIALSSGKRTRKHPIFTTHCPGTMLGVEGNAKAPTALNPASGFQFVEEFCTTTSQFSSCWASGTPTQALWPEARPKGWFQRSLVSEHHAGSLQTTVGIGLKNSPLNSPPNSRKNSPHCIFGKIHRTLLRNPQATPFLQGAARMLTHAKLGGYVIVQLACAMVQTSMCHALCIGRNDLSVLFHRQAMVLLVETQPQNVWTNNLG